MRVILIDDDAGSLKRISALLAKLRIKSVAALSSVQAGIEEIESDPDSVALAICNYRGGSALVLKAFYEAIVNIPAIVLAAGPGEGTTNAEILDRTDEAAFLASMDRLRRDGVLDTSLAPDSEFIQVPISSLDPAQSPPVDFYLRLAPNRYCLRFRKEDGLDAESLAKYAGRPGTRNLYARKLSLDGWLLSQEHKIDGFLHGGENAESPGARLAAEDSLTIVQNVVSQIGFSQKAEELAKKTVALTLKALGSSPELSHILSQISLHDGKYISSHSVMLAEVACALAHRLTWSSSTTFLKLTMAAFLHDLCLPANPLARARNLAEVGAAGSNNEQVVRMHPIRAAELARELRQLPADVDTIVLQHHEQPDGSGFPRGLFNHQISPLSCVFIVAQDLLNHFLDFGNSGEELLETFLKRQEPRYSQGTFRKIYDSLKTGEPAALA